jgi:hypothetical protein
MRLIASRTLIERSDQQEVIEQRNACYLRETRNELSNSVTELVETAVAESAIEILQHEDQIIHA